MSCLLICSISVTEDSKRSRSCPRLKCKLWFFLRMFSLYTGLEMREGCRKKEHAVSWKCLRRFLFRMLWWCRCKRANLHVSVHPPDGEPVGHWFTCMFPRQPRQHTGKQSLMIQQGHCCKNLKVPIAGSRCFQDRPPWNPEGELSQPGWERVSLSEVF